MSKAKCICGIESVPRYIMPDRSSPNYELIIEHLQKCGNSSIGPFYYYIKADDNRRFLCRIIHGGGRIFFHELVDHNKYGISDEDIEESLKKDTGTFSLPGLYPISPHIEQKLRVLYDI